MSYDGSSLTSQDIETFGGYLFVSFSGIEQIKIYSLATHELLDSIEIEMQHGTGMQFSNDFYDENDEFPLLYVGGWTTNQINVIRILKENESWTASIIKKLIIPTSEGYYLAPSIDNENNLLYCYGYKNNSNQAYNNKMILLKCDLSNLSENQDNTFTPYILNRIETDYMGVTQGRKYFNNRLYVGFSNTSSPHNSRLVAIDVNNGQTKTDVDLSGVTSSENEGVCYIIDSNNHIKWLYSDYYNVFQLEFL